MIYDTEPPLLRTWKAKRIVRAVFTTEEGTRIELGLDPGLSLLVLTPHTQESADRGSLFPSVTSVVNYGVSLMGVTAGIGGQGPHLAVSYPGEEQGAVKP